MEYTAHTGRSGSERGGSDPAFPSLFVPISKSADFRNFPDGLRQLLDAALPM